LNNKPSSSHKLIWIIVPIVLVLFLAFWAVVFIYFIKHGGFTSKQEVIFELDDSRITTVTRAELEETAFILTQRWEALGYTQRGVSFTVSENDQIIGRLPEDIDDNNQVWWNL
jgi:flagellar basal body-associated protein FliL